MVSRDFPALLTRRAARARHLLTKHPVSAEALRFAAGLSDFQAAVFSRAQRWLELPELRTELNAFIARDGPGALVEAARQLDEVRLRRALDDYRSRADTHSPASLFARVLLMAHAGHGALDPVADDRWGCPDCGHLPQVSSLRPVGHGREMFLHCSLCPAEWSVPRGICPSCQESRHDRRAYYHAPEIEHLQVAACETCRGYLHVVDLSQQPAALPLIDELIALPLDVWARQQGYRKIQVNVIGV